MYFSSMSMAVDTHTSGEPAMEESVNRGITRNSIGAVFAKTSISGTAE